MAGDAAEGDAADEVGDGFAIPRDGGVGVGGVGVRPGDTGERGERGRGRGKGRRRMRQEEDERGENGREWVGGEDLDV